MISKITRSYVCINWKTDPASLVLITNIQCTSVLITNIQCTGQLIVMAVILVYRSTILILHLILNTLQYLEMICYKKNSNKLKILVSMDTNDKFLYYFWGIFSSAFHSCFFMKILYIQSWKKQYSNYQENIFSSVMYVIVYL